jgi:hypothetical protein
MEPQKEKKKKCDESLWAEYERKKKTAEELFEAAAKQREEVTEEAAEFYKEQLVGIGEVAAIKAPPLYLAGRLRHDGLKVMAQTRGTLAEKAAYLKGSQVGGAVVTGAELGGAAATALWIYTMGEQTRQLNAEWKENQKMAAEAARLLREATDAFRAYGEQMKDCAEGRQKQQAAEKLEDRARELMETWENSGNLYKDPSGDILDSSAAFNRAKEILSRSSSFNDRPGIWIRPVAQTIPSQTPQADTNELTLDQVMKALAAVDESISLFKKGMDQLIQMHRTEENTGTKLLAFLKRF